MLDVMEKNVTGPQVLRGGDRLARRTWLLFLSLVPVLLWSSKPVLLEFVSAEVDSVSVIVWGTFLASVVSVVVSLLFPSVRRVAVSVLGNFSVVRDSAVAGVFLFVWYYGYYRALGEANQVGGHHHCFHLAVGRCDRHPAG